MDNIEQLNERIAQLTELVKSGSEAIKNMEIALKTAEEERDRLTEQRREQEPKFGRVKEEEKYYYIHLGPEGFGVVSDAEWDHPVDEARYDNNNYFHTKKRAQEVIDKINFLLKLERLHDIFCHDYVPDWNNHNETKFSIYYSIYEKEYTVQAYTIMKYKTNVYFPSLEIAQKVCDILNREIKE